MNPLVRPLEDAKRFDLTGRRVWLLASDADQLGDIVISVAKIFPGSMNAHAHAPGGEFMYVTAGQGWFWIEGIPLPLSKGTAVYTAPGLLHNAENTGIDELVVVGVMVPGMAPGSYPESPPLFEPTGRISSVDRLSCSRHPTHHGSGVVITNLRAHSDVPMTFTNIIDLPARSSIRRGARTACFWTVLSGNGSVEFLTQGPLPIEPMTTVLAPAGNSSVFASGDRPLQLLEVALLKLTVRDGICVSLRLLNGRRRRSRYYKARGLEVVPECIGDGFLEKTTILSCLICRPRSRDDRCDRGMRKWKLERGSRK